jgi:predicted phage-related endonuclease
MTKPAILSPEWYDERRTYIGASEAADALGLGKWGDPISVWERKVGERDERRSTFRMRLGQLIEPIIGTLAAEKLSEIRGVDVRLRRVSGPIRHPRHPFIGSNPDFRVIGWPALVQAKYNLDGEPWGDPDDGAGLGIPLHYRIQGWVELLTTGLATVYFAKLDPRSGLTIYPLRRAVGDNEEAIADLEADLVEYWTEYVEKGVAPPPTARSSEALLRRYPKASKVGRIASAAQEETLYELLEAHAADAAAGERLEALKNTVKGWLGSADYIEGAGHRFHWSNVGRDEDGEPKVKKVVAYEPIAKAYRALVLELIDPEIAPDVWREKLDAIESLYTLYEVAEPSRRFTIGEIK